MAIILIRFVKLLTVTLSFAVLDLDLLTTQRSGKVLRTGLEEVTSSTETAGA